MEQCEGKKELAPHCKGPGHESQSKAKRIHQRPKPENEPGAKPDPSSVSMKSNESKDLGLTFKIHQTPKPENEPGAKPDHSSSVSMKSNESKDLGLTFRGAQQSSEVPQPPQQHPSKLDSVFALLEKNMVTFVKKELKNIQTALSVDYPQRSESQRENEVLEGEDEEQRSSREALLKITVNFLRRMKENKLAEHLQSNCLVPICSHKLKSSLKQKFQCVFEGIPKAGNPTLLNQIYTELYITEGGTGEINEEHELRQIEAASRKAARAETKIKQEDIFKVLPGRQEAVRTVMTQGVAGIGKTVLTQKFTLDWAEGKTNQNIHFIFPFTFRELNVLKGKKLSLVELVHRFFTETKELCSFEEFQLIFILDGLDECRLPLDFHNKEILTDVTEATSVDVLLTNLIRGELLPSARLWITTRPGAGNQIPPEFVGMVTEVRGFTDLQKDEYFRKRFSDSEQASMIISHIKTSRSLHIMCHIPVFCWITATVLEDVMKTKEGGELPKTLTEMYIHFLLIQIKVRDFKYDGGAETDPTWSPESRKMMESLGKLALDGLQEGKLIFYESDLTECGIDIRAASVYSGVFTQIFKEERGLYQDKMFCFVHLSIQEFLAALHIQQTFINYGVNLMEEKPTASKQIKPKSLHQSAVDKALESPNGHLDLFLRFLLGLSLQTNHSFLRGLLTQTKTSSQTNQETVEYIKNKISANLSAEKSINLFHCLNELNDCSLVEQIQQSLRAGHLYTDGLSPAQWSALAFILVSSGKDLDVFDLEKYSASEDVVLRLLPVVKASNKAILSSCEVSERTCGALSSVFSSSSNLREMDLRMKDSGVELLSAALQSSQCKLETLRLRLSGLSEGNVTAVVSLVTSQTFSVRELHLSDSHLEDSGIQLLSGITGCPQLESLSLTSCWLSERSCEALSSVLSSSSSSLKELDLSNNDIKDSGVELLSDALRSSHYKLQTLRLSGCLITKKGCAFLALALVSKSSLLRELDLSYNDPGDSGKELLSKCSLQTLRMEPTGELFLTPGLRKYSCRLTIDANTVNRKLKLSDNNRKVTHVEELQSYPDHPDRFDLYYQLLCETGLTGRCYWEVEWSQWVHIALSYKTIRRKEGRRACLFGWNSQSWGLMCTDDYRGYSVLHKNIITSISSSSVSHKAGVYVDCPAGILSFYRISSDKKLIHLHTFKTTFTQTLYPGFIVCSKGSSVFLC